MSKSPLRPIANLVSVLLALAVNILASVLPLNGQNTGEISDLFLVYFVPAGYVFAIWGVIYIGWLAFAIYQLSPARRSDARLEKLGYWFALSGVFNAAWLVAWHYNAFPLSGLIMLALLGTLIVSYLRLNVGRSQAGALERWCVDVPFGLYLGWISVATIANLTDVLYYWQWNGFGLAPQVWAVIMLAVACGLGALMAHRRGDVAYLGVFVWAFAGIALKQAAEPLVSTSAWLATAVAAALLVYSLLRNRR